MVKLLAKIFIKNNEDYKNPEVRRKYGVLCGALGVVLNLLLFTGKIIVGVLSLSIAVMADAFNNLSDAGSSIISMIGFKMAGLKPDANHPFGHGRIEYISGLIVSMLIILMGFELVQTSIESIIHPKAVEYSFITMGILAASILVKLYMILYNKKIGNKIDSAAMKATAIDSLSDVVSSSTVLLVMCLTYFLKKFFNYTIPFPIDGYVGLCVAGFILYSGFMSGKETISPLLGTVPDKSLVKDIEQTVMAHKKILGIHDLVIHDYGPGRMMISLHAEVYGRSDLFVIHDIIDNIEVELENKFNCDAVIHLDPVDSDDKRLFALKQYVIKTIKKIDENLTIHDFRYVPGETHTNLIFDVVLDNKYIGKEEELRNLITQSIHEKIPNFNCVIKFDISYC